MGFVASAGGVDEDVECIGYVFSVCGSVGVFGVPFLGGERVGCFGGVLVDDLGEGFMGDAVAV